jgi:hypothetical protein
MNEKVLDNGTIIHCDRPVEWIEHNIKCGYDNGICTGWVCTKCQQGSLYDCQEVGNSCNSCGVGDMLVMHHGIGDQVCESCGEWQNGVYNSAYVRIG